MCLGEVEYGDRVWCLEMCPLSLDSSAFSSVMIFFQVNVIVVKLKEMPAEETSLYGQAGCPL